MWPLIASDAFNVAFNFDFYVILIFLFLEMQKTNMRTLGELKMGEDPEGARAAVRTRKWLVGRSQRSVQGSGENWSK